MPPSESIKDQFFGFVYQRLQKCIQKKQYVIRHTRKNMQTAASLGWTIDDQEDILLGLEPSHFQKADVNRDSPDSEEPVYFFLRRYEGKTLYIKLTFQLLQKPDGSGDFADIMSLHISDYDDNG